MNENKFMLGSHKLNIILSLFKPKRLRKLFETTYRELRLNGISGVINRARCLFEAPYSLLAYNIEEWNKIKKKNRISILPEFKYEKGKVSIIVPYSERSKAFSIETIRSLLRQRYEPLEVLVVASGYGSENPQKILSILDNKKAKIFTYPCICDEDRLIKKGIKEARGEHIFILKEDRRYGENFIQEEVRKGHNIIKNDDKLRRKLSPKIAYVVPAIRISGGLAIVLQHTNHLFEHGYDVSILSHNSSTLNDWFESAVPVIYANTEQQYLLDNIDILIATHWTTGFYMDLLPARRKIYFIQSDERRFNPNTVDEKRCIEATYRLECEYMTEAIWIQRWLKEEFGHNAYYVPNGIDLNIFHRTSPLEMKGRTPRVLIEGAIEVWFKGMDDAYSAIKDLDVDIWIVSCEGRPKTAWRYDRFFENVSINDMKRIYSSCDIFLKMSKVEGFFGPPMEAMACGCAVVVAKVTGFDEYIEDGKNALVVEMGDVPGAQKAIQRLIDDEELRKKLIFGGYETIKKWSWDRSITFLEKVLNKEPVEKFYMDGFPEKPGYLKNPSGT